MVTQCLTDSCTMTPGGPCGPSVGHGVAASPPQPTQIDSVSSNTGCSTMVTSSVTSPSPSVSPQGTNGGQGSPQPSTKRPGENRRSNKPIMEKRRRARINNCLNELKSLILDAMKKDPARHSKLEKADILEMTVKHLETMQKQQSAMTAATDPQVLNKFRAGFSECAGEVGKFPGLEPPVRRRLLQHLANVLNTSSGNEGTSSASLQANSQGNTSGTTIPGLQVHILPAVQATNDGNSNGAPMLTQQSILFSTSSNGTSLQLVPTRLPNGDIALVLPSSPANHQSQVNINLSGNNGTSSAKIVNGSCSLGTTLGTVIVPGTVIPTVSPVVAPSALSPLPMLIPISSRNSSQQSSGTVTPMISPSASSTTASSSVSSSIPSTASTAPSVSSSTSFITSTNTPPTTISVPSSTSFSNKQSFILSTVSSPQINLPTSSTFENRQPFVTSTVSPPPIINITSSSSSSSRQITTFSSSAVDAARNPTSSGSFDGETLISSNVSPINPPNSESFDRETLISSKISPINPPSSRSFDRETLISSNVSPKNTGSFAGNYVAPRNPSNSGSFAGENHIYSNFAPINPSPADGRLSGEGNNFISSDVTPRNHSPVCFASTGDRLITISSRVSSPLSLISVSSPSSSLASPVSPELRNIHQPHRQPSRDEPYDHHAIDIGQPLGCNSAFFTVPMHAPPNHFNDTQGIDLRIEQNRGFVTPPMTRPLSLVVKKTDEDDMNDEMPWRPW